MYQIVLSLKERQELVQLLKGAIEEGKDWLIRGGHVTSRQTIDQVREQIAHLENIKEKVEQAKIVPIKGLTK